eukprot:s382_g12.t1
MTDTSSSSDGPDSVVSFESLPGHYRLPCNQCLFFASAFGCKNGDACKFCHHVVSAEQAGGSLARPNSDRRRKIRRNISQLLGTLDIDAQAPQEGRERSASLVVVG